MHSFKHSFLMLTLVALLLLAVTESVKGQQHFLILPWRFLTAKWNVNERAVRGLCRGKRLDSPAGIFSPDNFIKASWCSSMGGDCCNLSPEWGFASNDPDRMDPNAKCHGCYDTTTPVQCSGQVLKGHTMDGELTAAGCLQSGGECCDPFLTEVSAYEMDAFDGFNNNHQAANELLYCSNCFAGPARFNATKRRDQCTGQLLLSDESQSAVVCSVINGQCCDGVYGPFDPSHYPKMDCLTCYSGPVQDLV